MNLRKTAKLSVLTMAIVLIFSSTVMASSIPAAPDTPQTKNISEHRGHKAMHGDSGYKRLLDELKISKEDINAAKSSGKTLFDLAKGKGYTPQQVKDKLLKYETEAINKAVSDKRLTKEKASDILTKKKERLSAWDGSFKNFHHRPKDIKFLRDLGLSKQEIEEARKSDKTIFDLAKEKKNLTPQQVKDMMIKDKTEAINKKVSEGKLTKEKGEETITNMKTRIQNWDGKFKK